LERTAHSYTMRDACAIARRAAADIEQWLRAKPETTLVRNVEDDPEHMRRDIDLIYEYADRRGRTRRVAIEIKGDRWHRTGNFFLETVSNEQRGTPGCFLYSAADYLFYYFVLIRKLYIIPMRPAREWFRAHMAAYPERRTTTPLGDGEFYNTVGRLVPCADLADNVAGVRCAQL
jgi:hypothetical protein